MQTTQNKIKQAETTQFKQKQPYIYISIYKYIIADVVAITRVRESKAQNWKYWRSV